jgi:hypothetical protein
MKLGGHKTVYCRYAIVDSTMLQEAVDERSALHAAAANNPRSFRAPFLPETEWVPVSIWPHFAVLLCALESGGLAKALDLGFIPPPGTSSSLVRKGPSLLAFSALPTITRDGFARLWPREQSKFGPRRAAILKIDLSSTPSLVKTSCT